MQVSTCWTDGLPLAASLSILRDLASYHARQGGSHGAAILALIREEDYLGLLNYELPLNAVGWNVSQLIQCRQALGFFSKLEDLDVGIDKEKVAFDRFVVSERSCRETNMVFGTYLRGSSNWRPRDVRVFERARRKIRSILGPCPQIADLRLKFGPGATTAIKRSQASPQNKMAAPMACCHKLYASGLLPELLREVPHWASAHAERYTVDDEGYLVEHVNLALEPGRLEFVPKNAKTYRAIVVEPVLSAAMQAGLGEVIAGRLLRVGVDIRDQSRNALLAKIGSQEGRLATIDLSSASDMIARELVRFLLPDDWFFMLDSCRSTHYSYRGQDIVSEKFSSMGNGFTFPLETLLFYALVYAAAGPVGCFHPDDVGVYGDDIICPVTWVDEVIRVLGFAGFVVNTDKSFTSGPFRESCGKDYYLGINVRPYYQKHLVSGESLFTLHNYYFRHGCYEEAQYVLSYIPDSLRIFGPDGYGDGHLVRDDWQGVHRPRLVKRGYGGRSFETFSRKPRYDVPRYPGDYISPLYSIYSRGREDIFPWESDVKLSTPVKMNPAGRPLWPLPGSDEYRKTLVYTLC